MATYKSAKVAAGIQPKGLRVGLVAETATFSVGAAGSLVAGDKIEMVRVPAGATVVYIAVSGGSGDALVSLGDGLDTDRYLAHSSMSSASTVIRVPSLHATHVGYKYSVDDTIDLDVSTVSVATITGGFHIKVIYSMDA